MWCFKVFYILLISFSFFSSGETVQVTGKLDFGESPSTSLHGHQNIHRIDNNPTTVYKTYKTLTTKNSPDDFDQIGTVCISGSCNKSKTDEENIETDVVVHVKTKVNVSDKKKIEESTPDIPVVLGVSPNDNTGDLFEEKSIAPTLVIDDPIVSPLPNYNTNYNQIHNLNNILPLPMSFSSNDPYYTSVYSTIKPNQNIEPKVDITIKSIPSTSDLLYSNPLNVPLQYQYGSENFNSGIQRNMEWYPKMPTNYGRNPPKQFWNGFNNNNLNRGNIGNLGSTWQYTHGVNNLYNRHGDNNGYHAHGVSTDFNRHGVNYDYNRQVVNTDFNKCICKNDGISFNKPNPWVSNGVRRIDDNIGSGSNINIGSGSNVKSNDPGAQINDKLAKPFH